jgi:hypothetical protein
MQLVGRPPWRLLAVGLGRPSLTIRMDGTPTGGRADAHAEAPTNEAGEDEYR